MAELPFSSLKRDPATNDLVLPIQLVYGRDAIAQRLRTRFHFFKGEWFLDRRLGVPYIGNLYVKNPNERVVRLLFRKVILSTPGIETLLSFDFNKDADRKARKAEISFEAKLSDASTFVNKPGEFIITVP